MVHSVMAPPSTARARNARVDKAIAEIEQVVLVSDAFAQLERPCAVHHPRQPARHQRECHAHTGQQEHRCHRQAHYFADFGNLGTELGRHVSSPFGLVGGTAAHEAVERIFLGSRQRQQAFGPDFLFRQRQPILAQLHALLEQQALVFFRRTAILGLAMRFEDLIALHPDQFAAGQLLQIFRHQRLQQLRILADVHPALRILEQIDVLLHELGLGVQVLGVSEHPEKYAVTGPAAVIIGRRSSRT